MALGRVIAHIRQTDSLARSESAIARASHLSGPYEIPTARGNLRPEHGGRIDRELEYCAQDVSNAHSISRSLQNRAAFLGVLLFSSKQHGADSIFPTPG
jgi:hypothetical protein